MDTQMDTCSGRADAKVKTPLLPAHVHVAINDIPMSGLRNSWCWVRIPFQAVFIAWTWGLSRERPPAATI